MSTGAPSTLPPPNITALTAPFWEALEEDRLTFQRCQSCANAFLPAREECPACLSSDLVWENASGAATLISWVVYHRPFSPAFEGRVPYTVAVVELAEGPRMISNIVGIDNPEALRIDEPLALKIERDGAVTVPRFSPAR